MPDPADAPWLFHRYPPAVVRRRSAVNPADTRRLTSIDAAIKPAGARWLTSAGARRADLADTSELPHSPADLADTSGLPHARGPALAALAG
ncbi:hypothetical protein RKE30_31720 [Streptomyces sp. Li-HN-5-11]|uniref:hypothetical protein n=1 Tax=Streptomyces sp. Li-HN-5-11 TaxID=3075432 RepID=UPI0028AC1839|nr:hypothetical protein [Streptomyces sp. Li-HN-5-11]WNM34617.1 hypothetical protein RKE30_31720 [Streptomyces sp. Li-HN-5-11]